MRVGLLFAGVTVVVLSGLWLLLSPLPDNYAELASSEGLRFELSASERRDQAPRVLQALQGMQIEIALSADSDDTLHLHGYELQTPTRTGQTSQLQFVASRSGRFMLELHDSQLHLATLEIYPRP